MTKKIILSSFQFLFYSSCNNSNIANAFVACVWKKFSFTSSLSDITQMKSRVSASPFLKQATSSPRISSTILSLPCQLNVTQYRTVHVDVSSTWLIVVISSILSLVTTLIIFQLLLRLMLQVCVCVSRTLSNYIDGQKLYYLKKE